MNIFLITLLLACLTHTNLQPMALDTLGDINTTGYTPYGIVFNPNGNMLAEIAVNTSTNQPGFLTYPFGNGTMTGTPLGGFVTASNTSQVSAVGTPCAKGVRWLPGTSMAAALFMLNSTTANSGSLNLNTFNCPSMANGLNATVAPLLGNVNASFLNGNLSANCCMDVSADGQYMAITDTVYDGNALSSTLYVLSQEGAVLALAALGGTLPGSISISPVSSAGTYYITVGGLDSTLRAFSFTANPISALTSLGTITTTGAPEYMAWHPSGLYLAVGTNTPSIKIYTFNGINAPVLQSTFTGGAPALATAVSALAWSSNGTYLAAVDGASGTLLRVLSFTGSTPALAQVGSDITLAGTPQPFYNSITWSPSSGFIAVVSASTSTLQVFSFNGTSTPVKVGPNLTTGLSTPYSVSWSSNGGYLAVGNYGNSSIQLFNFSATSTPTIASGSLEFTNTSTSGVGSVAWSPNGNYLAAVDRNSAALQVYSFSGGGLTQVGGNVTTGSAPKAVSWSSNGNYITVTNNGSATIQTFAFNGYSTPTAIVAGTTATGTSPIAGAWSPSGNYFAVVNYGNTTLQAYAWPYNTPTRIGTSLSTGVSSQARSVAWSPNGLYLATVTNTANQLQAWSFSTTSTPTAAALGSAVSTGTGSNPTSVAWSPNGNYIAVANYGTSTLQVYSFSGSTPVAVGSAVSTGVSSNPVVAAWSPNGNYIAVLNNTANTLQVYSFSGSTPVQIGSNVSTGTTPYSVAWSPNGNYLAVVNGGPSTLQIFSFSGRTPVQVGSNVTTAALPISAVWSPNGNYIAVTSYTGDALQVFSFSGSTPVLVGGNASTGANAWAAAWSPNGNYIVVTCQGTTVIQIFYFDGTNTPVQVGGNITAGTAPIGVAWSPNGQFIAVVNQGGNTLQLFYAPIFQNGQPLLNQLGNTVSTAAPVTSVAFSPNGQYIATAGSGIQMYSFSSTGTSAPTPRGSAAITSAVSRQVVWSPTNNYVAGVFDDGVLRVLSFNTSAPTTPTLVANANTMPLPTMCAWSPQGNAYNNNYIMTASSKNGGLRRLFYFDPISTAGNQYA